MLGVKLQTLAESPKGSKGNRNVTWVGVSLLTGFPGRFASIHHSKTMLKFGHSWGYSVRELRVKRGFNWDREIDWRPVGTHAILGSVVIRWWACANRVAARQENAPEAATAMAPANWAATQGLNSKDLGFTATWIVVQKRPVMCSCNWCWCECSSCIEHK